MGLEILILWNKKTKSVFKRIRHVLDGWSLIVMTTLLFSAVLLVSWMTGHGIMFSVLVSSSVN